MRHQRQLALWGVLAVFALAPSELRAERGDSAVVWLPREAAELESPDRLEDQDPVRGAGARAERRDGRWMPRHLWLDGRLRRVGDVRAEWLLRQNAAGWGTLRMVPRRLRAAVTFGAVVTRHPPALLGEAVELTRAARAPRSPSLSVPEFEAPRGQTSLALRGSAARFQAGPAGAWLIAGRNAANESVRAGGFALHQGLAALTAAAGARDGMGRIVSLGIGANRGERRVSGEWLLSPGRGPEILIEAAASSGPTGAAVRWRRRAGEARPVAAEWVLESGTRSARSRLSWRPWSVRSTGDDGRIELETSIRSAGSGPAKVRLGQRSGDAAALLGTPGAATGGERYVVADVTVARDGGRACALLLSARERRGPKGTSVASALGGRIELSSRRRAGATLVVQARRSRRGAEAGSDAAWTTALAPSGEEVLTAASGRGVAVSGRAWWRWGLIRIEGSFSDAAAPEREGSSAGSLRIEWERADP